MDAVGQFLLRPLDLGLELVADLHPVLDEILEPIPHGLQILERQPGQSRLDFLDAAHGHTIAQRYRGFKSRHGAQDSGTARKLTEAGHDGSVSVVRDPNSTIRVRVTTGASEVSLHPSSLKENPVQAWFDKTGRFIILEYTGQRAQIWDPATGLPITPVFQSRYATNEAEYRTVKLPDDIGPSAFARGASADKRTTDHRPRTTELTSAPRPLTSDFRLQAELLAGSRLDGTGGWKPLELGEIVARWDELNGRTPSFANGGNE